MEGATRDGCCRPQSGAARGGGGLSTPPRSSEHSVQAPYLGLSWSRELVVVVFLYIKYNARALS